MAETMTIPLHGPGMTSLHKVGLAGLYMTLNAFDQKRTKIDGLSWSLRPDKVVLEWKEEKPKRALEKLIAESFKIDGEGFFHLAGLESGQISSIAQKYLLYKALLNTFLQFGPHRPTETKRTLSYEVDDKSCWVKEFSPIKHYRHQGAAKEFLDTKERFRPEVDVAGWLYPGGGQRHVAHKKSKLGEPPELALSLLFLPVGSIFFLLSSKTRGRKARAALLLPAIENLESYADIRQYLISQSILEITASGASDALLKFLMLLQGRKEARRLSNVAEKPFECRVITFGIVDWNEKQKSRTMTRSVFSGEIKGIGHYFLAHAIFKNAWQLVKEKRNKKGQLTEPEHHFAKTFTAREIIAENIAKGLPWFRDFSTYMTKKEIREQLLYERKELNDMVNKAVFDDEREKIFIAICHEAWRRRLGKLGERARRENTSFSALVNREFEKLRVAFSRCKNEMTLRETVVDFWARAGSIQELQGHWPDILPLFSEKNWRLAKDLSLLALVSYQPKDKDEEEALIDSSEIGGDENE